ncbi:fumarylacetoacetate hydrolase family protein [Steroidobacter sp. S1-65]|uniref:Fumarylacetoacetate hydrolase family protein n=1 Tax=Steroidobacter gossypii TaxID=2805490 RepID=A0ABS1X345_9GAMM|nr:fumarylacetoacetate hydrolase family protein [Steroidobacter gossypii]MBM0107632.1 fumarylacetoacetate hydrolase family protein [Steroidobacter gossypii]
MSLLDHLPADWRDATLVGRIATAAGPTPVVISHGRVRDVSRVAPTVADLLNQWSARVPAGEDLGPLEQLPLAPAYDKPGQATRLLAPVDLQCVKACGVTFAVSAVERVIEERARGDYAKAQSIRDALGERVGADIRSVKPGSPTAVRLKEALIADGLWSQYLEVAIGPDAEVFTKSPVLSSVGWGDWIGVRKESQWNNPEPEIVLACDSNGRTLGATLGNDVNLRDIEGRSALLLGKAKDNNASCAIGPFIRMFDSTFGIDDVRKAVVSLTVHGEDGYKLEGSSSMSLISRDPLELVEQTLSQHQYPDGFALFLGTMFAPTDDRDVAGRGFTHKVGDVVRVSSPALGTLENKLTTSDQAPPWSTGISHLMRNLASRGLLASRST